MLDGGDGLLAREHAADGEEAGLHDGVDAHPHAGLLRHLVGVDDVEPQLLLDDLLLRRLGQVVPDLVRSILAVEQKCRPRSRLTQDVQPLQEAELMTGHEAGLADEISGMDRLGPEAEVGDGLRA